MMKVVLHLSSNPHGLSHFLIFWNEKRCVSSCNLSVFSILTSFYAIPATHNAFSAQNSPPCVSFSTAHQSSLEINRQKLVKSSARRFAAGHADASRCQPAPLGSACWRMAVAAVRSVPSRQESPAMKQMFVIPTKGSTATTRETSLGMKQACVHVSCSFTFPSWNPAGWEPPGKWFWRGKLRLQVLHSSVLKNLS